MTTGSAIDAVVFDVGGVLTPDLYAELAIIDVEYGLPRGTLQGVFRGGADFALVETGKLTLREFFTRLVEKIRTEFGVEVDKRRVAAAAESVMRPRPEMVALATELGQAGLRVALLTNMISESRTWLAGLLPDGVVSLVVDSSEVGLRKPDPRIYRHLLDRLCTTAERVVYFDDQEENLPPALEMGINACLFKDVAQVRSALRAHGVSAH